MDSSFTDPDAIGFIGNYSRRPIEITAKDVQYWVSVLQDRHREFLALGPIGPMHPCDTQAEDESDPECRVCLMCDEFWDDEVGYSSKVVELLAEFHHDNEKDDDSGLRSYLACLYIYLCAGWTGEHV